MKLFIKYQMLFLCIVGMAQNNSQPDSISINQVSLLNSNYKDFVNVKDIIYAISNDNELITIDYKKQSYKSISQGINAITLKSNNEVVFGNKDGEIFLINNKLKITKIDEIDAEIFSIHINSKDEYVIHSNKSIYYNGKNYIPKKETTFYGKVNFKYTGTQLIEPDYIFIDKKDFMWFAFDEGEWGGSIYFFDLNEKEFIYNRRLRLDNVNYSDRKNYYKKLIEKYPNKIKVTKRDTIYKYPYYLGILPSIKGHAYNNADDLFITSIGSGHTRTYVSANNYHYSVDGSIYKIYKKEKNNYKYCSETDILNDEKYKGIFENNSTSPELKNRELIDNVLTESEINKIGSVTFNKFDNKIYFYSLKGFYTLNNSGCTFTKRLYFVPKVSCKPDRNTDHCYHLNVIKFEFINANEILFLTKNDGIGYYDGENVKYFR